MGARIRAGKPARDRAAHGLDLFGGYEPAGLIALREQGGGGGLLRAPRHSLPGVRTQGAGAAQNRLCRQFRLRAHRPLDALVPRTRTTVTRGRTLLYVVDGPVAQLDRAAAF